MGQAKERQIELESHAYGEPEKKLLCSDHFPDYGIKQWINSNGESGECFYCGKKSKVISSLSIVDFIGAKILDSYTDPVNELGWNDGQYYAPEGKQPMDEYELFAELGIDDIEPSDLCEDFIACFSNQEWIIKDPYGVTPEEELSIRWSDFSRMVKHSRRFTFFRSPDFNRTLPDPKSENAMFDILTEIESAVNSTNLIKTIPVAKTFFRGQVHHPDEVVDTFQRIASPPGDKAKQNRMSPAGVSMFYGAYDSGTAQAEIESGMTDKDLDESITTMGKFVNIVPLRLIDFTDMPVVSFFADDDLDTVGFLRSFAYKISQPIDDPDKVHVDYAPTQVITEYFRYVFRARDKKEVHGLVYRSSCNHKPCVVLFLNQKDCPLYLELESSQRVR